MPKVLIWFRKRSDPLPESLDAADLDPSALGIQLTSVPAWQMQGTPTLEFAFIGKGPQKSPTAEIDPIDPNKVWSYLGTEVRVWLWRDEEVTSFDPADPDPAEFEIVFCGTVEEIRPSGTADDPWFAYLASARGLMARAERVPVVSVLDNSDRMRFNINALLSEYEPATAGKSFGEAIRMILENYAVARPLSSRGIGLYTIDDEAKTAELPASTLAELARIDIVPPFEFTIGGDNIVAAISQTLDAYCPNYGMTILPSGRICFYDIREYAVTELDTNEDLILIPQPTKSTLGCYARVIVRGAPKIVPYYCQWNVQRDNSYTPNDDSPDAAKFNGELVEYFDYTGKSNLQAKQAFEHSDYTWGRILLSVGTLSFVDADNEPLPSNEVRITPATGNLPGTTTPNLRDWIEDELLMIDGTTNSRRECRLIVERRYVRTSDNLIMRSDRGEFTITANTAANSTATDKSSTLQTSPNVDRPPIPPTGYRYDYSYELTGYTREGSTTWRRYKVVLDDTDQPSTQTGMVKRLAYNFITPQDSLHFSNVGDGSGTVEAKTWYPVCLVEYRTRDIDESWSYSSFWTSFRIDPVHNQIILGQPSVFDTGNPNLGYANVTPPWDTGSAGSPTQPFQIVPYNIKALIPVYDGVWEAVYPPEDSEIEAKVKTLYGIDSDLVVTLEEWNDGRDQAYAERYAEELWDSVQQPNITGSLSWVDGIPDGLPIVCYDTTATKLAAVHVTVGGGCDPMDGTGLEECDLILTSCQIRYQPDRKPFTLYTYATAKPRFGVPMMDLHTFAEHMARDPLL